jgi:hypothetical protein
MSVSQNFPNLSPSLSLDFAKVKKLDPRITFSRATSAVAYDGQTVTKAEENLLLYSQEFDNGAWIKYDITTTANAAIAPDGTTTADAVFPNTNNALHFVRQVGYSGSTEQQVISFFAKANGYSFVSFRWAGLSVGDPIFDLSTGTISSGSNGTISDAGNGWYRCSVVFTPSNTGAGVRIYLGSTSANVYSSYTGSGTDGIYIWGAQLEQRDTVTAYTPTTTQTITNYIPTLLTAPADSARFDHNPVTGESLGLLVEEQRTNLQTYSEDFTNAVWNNETSRTIITENAIVAPDGTLTATKFSATTENNLHRVYNFGLYLSAGVATTISFYAKRSGFDVSITDSGGRYAAVFNLATGISTAFNFGDSITASMVSVGNGWYRCIATVIPIPSGNFPLLSMCLSDGVASFEGNGYDGYFIWGYQLEAGSFPTSYIKTEASQVTRSADSASMTGANFSDWYNPSQSTVYCESSTVAPNSAVVAYSPYALSSGSATNAIFTQYYNGAVNSIVRTVPDGEAARMNFSPIVPNTFYKTVLASAKNDFATSTSGSTVVVDTLGVMPSGVNVLTLGISYSNQQPLNGHIRKLSYYPKRLSNENLQALTS